MLSHKNTKNANFLFIVDMLKDLLEQELITDKKCILHGLRRDFEGLDNECPYQDGTEERHGKGFKIFAPEGLFPFLGRAVP